MLVKIFWIYKTDILIFNRLSDFKVRNIDIGIFLVIINKKIFLGETL